VKNILFSLEFEMIRACLLSFTLAATSVYATAAAAAPDQTLGMALLGAHIGFDGSLLNGAGVVDVISDGNGRRIVQFNRNVLDCFYSVSSEQWETPSTVANYQVTRVLVGLDSAFFLTVFCPR
jgi:hypothetical protein